MAFDGDMRHLTSEQIQDFLDERLSPQEEAVVQEHLYSCPHCQSEMEGWQLLYGELGNLPVIAPDTAFADEVMARVTVREPWGQRIRGWMEERAPRKAASAHPTPERIQDYVEGLLPAAQAARAGAHLEACTPCREELTRWERVFVALGSLGRFAPSPGFAGRVMARVKVPVPAPTLWGSEVPPRVLAWARNALPRNRRAWAIAGGVASAPTITVAALVYMVFSGSNLTVDSLITYTAWKAAALFGALFTTLLEGAMESAALLQVYTFLRGVASSPLLLGAGGLTFSLLSAGALWVLYRNLIVAPSDEPYARAQV